MAKKFSSNKSDILKFTAVALTGSAVLVAGMPATQAEEIENVINPVDDVTETTVTTQAVSTTTGDSAHVEGYSRQNAFDKQNKAVPDADRDEFVKHVVDNKDAVTVNDKEEIVKLISDSIKGNEAVVVIDDPTGAFEQIALEGNIDEEIKKSGSSASSLIAGLGLSTVLNDEGETVWVLMPYYEETNAIADAKEQFVEQVSSYVNDNYSTPIEKLHAIYSYLGQTTVYNLDADLPASSPASLVLNNEAVCEAFAYLYNELAEKVGVNARYVTGVANNGTSTVGHAWNLVEIDGEWYNSDATFGNIDRNGENSLEVNMSFFLFSDEKASLTHSRHYDTLPKAEDTSYDAIYNNDMPYAFGGGVTGDLIVSPNTNEIVVFDTSTGQVSGLTMPTSTEDYDIFTSALVGSELFVTYLDYNEGAMKVGKIDFSSSSPSITPLETESFGGTSHVKYKTDGIYVNEQLVYAFDESTKLISRDLKTDIQVGDDNTFALEKAYNDFVVEYDNTKMEIIDQVYENFNNDLPVTELIDILDDIHEIKNNDLKAAQLTKYQDHVAYLDVIGAMKNVFLVSTDTLTENLLIQNANTIQDEVLRNTALGLISAHKEYLISIETPVVDPTPTEPTDPNPVEPTPTEPTDPNPVEPTPTEPTDPNPVDPTPTEPTEPNPVDPTPTEPTEPNPVDPTPTEPTEPTPVEPTPTEPTEPTPVEPTPTEPTEPTPVEPTPTEPTNPSPVAPTPTEPTNPSPVAPTPTEPTNPSPVAPTPTEPTNPSPVAPTPTEPTNPSPVAPTPTEPANPSPVEQTPTEPTTTPSINIEDFNIQLSDGMSSTAVEMTLNENNNLVITSTEVSNTKAVTITIPVEFVKDGVLKIRTANGLEPVPYKVVDGKIIVTLYKTGELVFDTTTATLNDIANNQYRSQIQLLADRGIITGDNGNYNAGDNINRAQFVGLLVKGLGLNTNEETNSSFNDLNSDTWYANSAKIAKDLGIVQGNNGDFNAGDNITRQQAFTMIGRVLEQNGFELPTSTDLANFKDAEKVSDYAKGYVALLIELGIVSGDNGLINAQENITKGQMAKILTLALEKLGKL